MAQHAALAYTGLAFLLCLLVTNTTSSGLHTLGVILTSAKMVISLLILSRQPMDTTNIPFKVHL